MPGPPAAERLGTAVARDPPALEARVLGSVRVAVAGRPLPLHAWPRHSARALLLLLIATSGHRLGRERAADLLWPDAPPDRLRSTWYQAVSTLRRVLEPDLPARRPSSFLAVDATTIALQPGLAHWFDIDAFEAGLARASDGTIDRRRSELRAAIVLYRGDLLVEELGAEWATPRRQDLRERWRRGVLQLAALDLQAGTPLASLANLQAVVAADPTAEEAHRSLIAAFLATGQPDAARRQYERCRRALWDDLGIEPSEATRELGASCGAHSLREGAPAAASDVPRRLPPAPASPLLGRDREVTLVEDLVWSPDHRLVTVCGPGGIGKTRLAIEVAHQLDREGLAVVFLSLASLQSPGHVLSTVAQALGLRQEASASVLARRIGKRQLLLVLDSFEHVIEAAAEIARLLAAAPELRVMVTSRLPLRLAGEQIVEVPPLTVPAGRHPSFAALARSDAVALFVGRAQAVQADFVLTAENAPTIARLCARLDGLPLAIELAAARVRLLSPRAMLSRLDRRLDLLTGGRRDAPARLRTMRDAIAWSHDLLLARERVLFRRLAVFSGGFTLDAAEGVALRGGGVTPSPTVFDALSALVDHCLLRQEEQEDGEPRFAMLETIRAYALERLEASGEGPEIRRRHALHLVALAKATVPGLTRTAQVAEVDRLALELANIRGALAWALAEGEATTALSLATATFQLWFVRTMPGEGLRWLEQSLAAAGDAPAELRADGLLCASSLAFLQGDLPRLVALAEAALAIARGRGDRFRTGVALFQLGVAAEYGDDLDLAAERYDEALALMRSVDEPYWVALLLSSLADVNLWRGDGVRGAVLAAEGLARWRALGNDWGIAQGLGSVAAVAAFAGEHARAAQLYLDCLARCLALGDRRGMTGALAGLAGVANATGRFEQAARLLGAAWSRGAEVEVRHLAHHLQFERAVAATRARLDSRTFTEAWEAGGGLSIERAVGEARMVAEEVGIPNARLTGESEPRAIEATTGNPSLKAG